MTFEQALAEMRKGKEVIFNGRSVALTIKDNDIVEVYNTKRGKEYSGLYSMNVCNIMRDDWEIVDER